MNVALKKYVTYKASYVRLQVAVKYDEEDMPNNFPGRVGDMWTAEVNLDNGDLTIDRKPFPPISLDLHMKVTDAGSYSLHDACGEQIAKQHQGYVPSFFPGNHYGDYIIFNIVNGRIQNWRFDPKDVAVYFQEEA